MKTIPSTTILLAALLTAVSSCLNSDDTEPTLYDDAAITSFQITTAEQLCHTLSASGQDSTYTATGVSMTAYKFAIDHMAQTVANHDSLPYGIDATKLLCEYTAKNNGTVYLRAAAGDEMRMLASTDTVDLSYPRVLRTFASDGQHFRDYTLTVNVHHDEAGKTTWQHVADAPALAALAGLRLATVGGLVYAAGRDAAATHILTSVVEDGTMWAELPLPLTAAATTAASETALYAADQGRLYTIADGQAVSQTILPEPLATAGCQLLAATRTALYAMSAGTLYRLTADGAEAEAVDSPEALPAAGLTAAVLPHKAGAAAQLIVMTGETTAPAHTIYTRIDENETAAQPQQWMRIEQDNSTIRLLPAMRSTALTAYNGWALAAGTDPETSAPALYETRDGGITWFANAHVTLPAQLDGQPLTQFAAAGQADGRLWIVADGQVWRGRLHEASWRIRN